MKSMKVFFFFFYNFGKVRSKTEGHKLISVRSMTNKLQKNNRKPVLMEIKPFFYYKVSNPIFNIIIYHKKKF